MQGKINAWPTIWGVFKRWCCEIYILKDSSGKQYTFKFTVFKARKIGILALVKLCLTKWGHWTDHWWCSCSSNWHRWVLQTKKRRVGEGGPDRGNIVVVARLKIGIATFFVQVMKLPTIVKISQLVMVVLLRVTPKKLADVYRFEDCKKRHDPFWPCSFQAPLGCLDPICDR